MHLNLTPGEFKRIQNFIEQNCGISIPEEKAYLIESRLSRIIIESGYSGYEAFFQAVSTGKDSILIEKIIDAITTNETLWFRDQSPWIILEKVLLPEYVRLLQNHQKDRIRIWSAGCSTGQEPYSIAMCIDRYLARNKIADVSLSRFEIVASDISRPVISAAQAGQYDNISMMRGLDEQYKNIYFKNTNGLWVLDEKIRNAVVFKQFNLQEDFYGLGEYELVFCRYILIYFSDLLKKKVLAKICKILKDNGILFIGSSELLMDYSHYYTIEQLEGGVVYRRKGNAG